MTAERKTSAFLALLPKTLRPGIKSSELREPPLKCQKRSNFIQLPDDILAIVICHLNTASAASLIQTCRYFQELLEPILYRHLNLSWHRDQTDKAHRTLAKRQDLIPHIQSYHGPLTLLTIPPPRRRFGLGKSPKSSRERLVQTECFRNTINVLSQAFNIRDLELWDSIDWASDTIWEPVTKAVCKMRLIRLVYFVNGKDDSLCQILQTQPHLEHLTIHGGTQNLETLDKRAIPTLRGLTAGLEEAAAIVPGRPIEELHISCYSGTPDIDDPLFRNLSLSTQIIKIFSLDLLWWNGEGGLGSIFKVVALNLPKIEQLTFWYGGLVSPQVVSTFLAPTRARTLVLIKFDALFDQILDGIPLFLSIRQLALLCFDLTVTTEQSPPSAGALFDYDAFHKRSVADNWDDVFQILKQRCPLLVDFKHTPRT